jgi:hypothetical protein
LTHLKGPHDLAKLSEADKQLIAYYHANKWRRYAQRSSVGSYRQHLSWRWYRLLGLPHCMDVHLMHFQHHKIETKGNHLIGTSWPFRGCQVVMHEDGFTCNCKTKTIFFKETMIS